MRTRTRVISIQPNCWIRILIPHTDPDNFKKISVKTHQKYSFNIFLRKRTLPFLQFKIKMIFFSHNGGILNLRIRNRIRIQDPQPCVSPWNVEKMYVLQRWAWKAIKETCLEDVFIDKRCQNKKKVSSFVKCKEDWTIYRGPVVWFGSTPTSSPLPSVTGDTQEDRRERGGRGWARSRKKAWSSINYSLNLGLSHSIPSTC
jgi:hypothetical protein